MIEAEQVAQAVAREVEQLRVQAALGLAARGVQRDHDVAEQARVGRRRFSLREREHVGRLVLAAPARVELVDRGVVAYAHRDLVVAGGRDHARQFAAQPARERGRQCDAPIDNQSYWHLPLVHVVPLGHTSTALAPPVNSGDVHAVPAATVPRTFSV